MRIERYGRWHIKRFLKSLTKTEYNRLRGWLGRGVAEYLWSMMNQDNEAYVLVTDRKTPVAFMGVCPYGNLYLVVHPQAYSNPTRSFASLVLPVYRQWAAKRDRLAAKPSCWNRDARRWYDDLGFEEWEDDVMIRSRPFEGSTLVPNLGLWQESGGS